MARLSLEERMNLIITKIMQEDLTDSVVFLTGVGKCHPIIASHGLDGKQVVKYQKNFWSVLNDRNKISKNILLNHHVKVVEAEGKKLLEIDVPAADRDEFSDYFLDYREECDDKNVR